MAKGNYSASDLDIFGESEKDEAKIEAGAESGDTAIFNGKEDDDAKAPEAAPAKDADKKPEDAAKPDAGGKDTVEKKDEKPEDKPLDPEGAEPKDAPADPELEKLFKELEDEAGKKKADMDKMNSIIDELRTEAAGKDAEIAVLKKRCDTLQEKLMSGSDEQTDWKLYEPVIKTLEEKPQIMALAKLWSRSSDERAKSKLVKAASDILSELTGEDVSDLVDSKRKDSVIAMTRKGSGKAPETEDEGASKPDDSEEPESNKIFNY